MAGADSPSSSSPNRLDVSRAEEAVLIQVFGLGNMFLAPTLQSFVESELNSGFHNFVIDLKCCDGMDSTFMGTFIGLSNTVKCKYGWFCLVNVSEENLRLLKMLGVIHMVSINNSEFPLPEGEVTSLYPTTDPYARLRQIQSAHKLLIAADSSNEVRFGPFIKAMAAELSDIPIILPPSDTDEETSEGKRNR